MKEVLYRTFAGIHPRVHAHFDVVAATLLLALVGFSPSEAARRLVAGPAPAPVKQDVYNPNQLLVKFKAAQRTRLHDGNPRQTGVASVDADLTKNHATSFKQIAKPGRRSKATAEVFGWYVVSLDPNRPIVSEQINGQTVYPELEQLQQDLQKDASVESVQKNYQIDISVVPNDPYYSSVNSWGQGYDDLWGLKSINAATAWDTTTGSSSVTVGVIDTGVDTTQAELAGNIWTNPGEIPGNGIDDDGNGYVDDVHGWNWYSGTNNVMDDNGHGTHVAGTIAAVGNNGSGVAGVSWSSKIMPLKFMSSGGSGSTAAAVLALQYAADMGAKVTNNSWTCACTTDTALTDAVKYEHDANVTTVAAAGNNNGADALNYVPGAADGAITVAATDHTNAIASFSNVGQRVDVSAPGVAILSLKSSAASSTCVGASIVNTNYCQISGTSMATPHVAGLAALMLARNPALTPEQIRQIMRSTATDLGTAGRDSTFGSGLINAAAAVAASGSPTVLAPVITAPASRDVVSNNLTVTGTASGANFASYKVEIGPGRSNLSWTTLNTSSTPITNGNLASFDTTSIPDGWYTIRLTATTSGAQSYIYETYDIQISNFSAILNSPKNIVPKGLGNQIVGTAYTKNGLVFDHYTMEWGSGATPSSWSTSGMTLASGGLSIVDADVLGTWDTSALTDGSLYTMRLTVYGSNGSFTQATQTVGIDAKLVAGWPKYLPGSNCGSFCSGSGPVFADLDGDGQKEVIVAGADYVVYAYHKDGTPVAGWPVYTIPGEYFTNPPIVADLDGDLKPEIILNSVVDGTTRRLYILKGDGTFYPGWTFPTMQASNDFEDLTPTVADIDGDGKPELVYINYESAYGTRMHAWHVDGTEAAGFPKTLSSVSTPWMRFPVSISDIDNDGVKDIMYATYNKLYVLTPTGSIKSGWPVTLPNNAGTVETIQGTPAVGDVDGDGKQEVIVTGQANGAGGVPFRAYAYASNGTLMSGWPYTASTNNGFTGLPLGVASTADIDGDGKDEVMTGQGSSSIIDDGTGKRSTPYFMGQGQLSMADFDGDGNIKFPGSYNHGMQWGNNDLSVYWHDDNFTTYQTQHGDYNPFMVGDLDRNGSQEFAADVIDTSEEYVYLWELPGTTHPKDSWPMFTHDPARTSHYTVGQITSDTTAPQVVLTSPTAGPVSGTVGLAANAIDDVGVSSVSFYDGASLISTDTTFPYTASWNAGGATPGPHSLTARATDASSNTGTSAAVGVTVADTTAPSVPANLHATATTDTSISLAWSASADDLAVTGYKVYRGGTLLGSTASTSYTDSSGLAPATSYNYTVTAYDAAGNSSAPSGVCTTSTSADATAPSIPTGLTKTGATVSTITLSWNAATDNAGVTGYVVLRNGSNVGQPSGTTYTDTLLSPNTSYTYTVEAKDAVGNVSGASTPLAASTQADITPPASPASLFAASATLTSISLSWSASTDDVAVTGYHLYRAGSLIASPSGTTYTDTSLTPGTTYAYGVEAVDAAGNISARTTANLATVADTTAPAAPASLLVSSITNTTASLSWPAATDDVAVTGYRIYLGGVLTGSTGATNYNLSGLTSSTMYNAVVTAIDAAGNESLGIDSAAFTTDADPPAPGVASVRGDANGDGHVTLLDLSLVLAHYGRAGSQGDLDGNNRVDLFDLSIVLHEYGK